ncbi:MAG: hypothetical protein FWH53_08225 [Leptospirales bacterium]|nr:hypothetical protein [Leptospirales bacterium]
MNLPLPCNRKKLTVLIIYWMSLIKKSLDSKTKEILKQISDQVLIAEFDNALGIIGDLINNNTGEKQ